MDRFVVPVVCLFSVLALIGLVIDDRYGSEGEVWGESWGEASGEGSGDRTVRVHSRLAASERLDDETGSKRLTHRFRAESERIQLTARLKLRRGSFSLRLIDPDERVVWQHAIDEPGHDRFVESFKGIAGEWRLELEYRDAKGRYDLRLESR